ncbi:unnamed protein product [Bursaphelenchus xylophilus]|uniref:(pine wood nematode) hypothetical protein n=1 Tax=Bursaphelenchus xylophilus TaxID=6326 RepID=A0A1I7SF45_BURXY|nr:unnamed protein product [Bursaphelenchus xylophilus]CAG9078830.1 unnamed protein product [Bursaphelenchus xylophilus]
MDIKQQLVHLAGSFTLARTLSPNHHLIDFIQVLYYSRAMNSQFLVLFVVIGLVVAGPIDNVLNKLNPSQKNQLKQLVKDSQGKPRAQVREGFQDFFNGMSDEFRESLKKDLAFLDELTNDLLEKGRRLIPDNQDQEDQDQEDFQ